MSYSIRWLFFFIGLMFFSLGISITINVQYLGIHPWDVLSVGLFEKYGFTIGTWNIICGILLVFISFILDKSYIKLGTFLNAFLVGIFVDLFLWFDFLPHASLTWWVDIVILLTGIVFMGFGGGMYNAAGVGSGPRDGFMLSISDKTGAPIRRVRIITETSVLIIGWLLGGPVFIFTFLFTFIQSPLFQFFYLKFKMFIDRTEKATVKKQDESA
ncbi:YczE/YyaS/YitT family protein [Virgibacillus flavescens]|uniref:YczE/YyaS/YitT family protein n=1 Tax=Virgibacillus flavescens TaxID=1611422 RepID=UPI003D33C6D4